MYFSVCKTSFFDRLCGISTTIRRKAFLEVSASQYGISTTIRLTASREADASQHEGSQSRPPKNALSLVS